MSRFRTFGFDPLAAEVFLSLGPLPKISPLRSLAWMARGHLSGFTREELFVLEAYVEESISDQRQEYVETEMNSYVDRLLYEGGWELDYLECPEQSGEHEIRELLTNWPWYAEEQPSLPSPDDLSEVDAMELAIEKALPAIPWFSGDLEKLNDPAAAAAVFALMLVAEALHCVFQRSRTAVSV